MSTFRINVLKDGDEVCHHTTITIPYNGITLDYKDKVKHTIIAGFIEEFDRYAFEEAYASWVTPKKCEDGGDGKSTRGHVGPIHSSYNSERVRCDNCGSMWQIGEKVQ